MRLNVLISLDEVRTYILILGPPKVRHENRTTVLGASWGQPDKSSVQ